jgi:hypothetical protein
MIRHNLYINISSPIHILVQITYKTLRAYSVFTYGCRRITSEVKRLVGSTNSNFFIIFCALAGTYDGILNMPFEITLCSSLLSAVLNGKIPQQRAYKITPTAHTSTGGPMYSLLFINSGHMYEGVPQYSFSFVFFLH